MVGRWGPDPLRDAGPTASRRAGVSIDAREAASDKVEIWPYYRR